jgi:hypothetical protein
MYGDPTKSRLETLSYDSVVAAVGPKTKTKTKNGKRTFIIIIIIIMDSISMEPRIYGWYAQKRERESRLEFNSTPPPYLLSNQMLRSRLPRSPSSIHRQAVVIYDSSSRPGLFAKAVLRPQPHIPNPRLHGSQRPVVRKVANLSHTQKQAEQM